MEKAIRYWLGDYDPVGDVRGSDCSKAVAEVETIREGVLRAIVTRALDGHIDAVEWLDKRMLVEMPPEHECPNPAPNINLVPAGTQDDETPKGE